jgi:hypothetical protein
MAYNAKCDPLNNNIDIYPLPPLPGLPGFSLDVNFPTIDIPFPAGFPEDILDWVRRLKFVLPGGGILKEILDSLQKAIASIIADLLGFLNLFLSMYNFVIAIIEIIVCIINVLTAMMSIRKTIKRIKCLIRKCFPLFIRIVMPFLALLALLLALIAMLLALIEYIIELIKKLIEQILRNIKRLKSMFEQGNSNAALAIISKIADLMCLFEHVFVLLAVIDLIISVIKGKWDKNFKMCNGGDSSGSILSADKLCAAFLQAPDSVIDEDFEIWNSRVKGTNGEIFYCNSVYGQPLPSFPAASIAQIRPETVYLRDNMLVEALQFKNLISFKPLNENKPYAFFPFDKNIHSELPIEQIPYFVTMKMNIDPNDGYGTREITIENTVVTLPTTKADLVIINGKFFTTTDARGFVKVTGGTTIDPAGYYDGFTIEQLLADNSGLEPSSTGSGTNAYYTNVEHQLIVNFIALAEYALITMDCLPSMQVEYAYFDEVYAKPLSPDLPNLVDLPNVTKAISDLTLCLNNFRKNINEETTVEFGACMNNILADLSDQANNTYCQLLQASFDIYNTDLNLEPSLQFITQPINIKVTPKNADGKTMEDLLGGFSSSINTSECIGGKITATTTLGVISDFTYDGYGNFVADLTSDVPGDGYVEIFYDGQQIPILNTPTSLTEQPSIDFIPLEFTFVGFFGDGFAAGVRPLPRRDDGDTSNS